MTQKFMMNMRVVSVSKMGHEYSLISLMPVAGEMPQMLPGQFVQIEIPQSKTTFLRRPISICDCVDGCLRLLVRKAGAGTAALADSAEGYIYNVILPLGHGFADPTDLPKGKILLVGGGVGIAPLLFYGRQLHRIGKDVEFLIGGRSADDILLRDELEQFGRVHITTDDGSEGVHGLVTSHPVLTSDIAAIACCGPTPMMKAVAKIASDKGIECEVSLENMMACGLGACLCCVEETEDKGNVCVCTEGPVFNINRLKWNN